MCGFRFEQTPFSLPRAGAVITWIRAPCGYRLHTRPSRSEAGRGGGGKEASSGHRYSVASVPSPLLRSLQEVTENVIRLLLQMEDPATSLIDPSFPVLLHDKLQVPNSTRKAWNERDSRCDVCATHLNQLKQEAIHMVLTLEQGDTSPGSPPPLGALVGSRSAPQGPPRDWAYLPSAYHTSSSSSTSTAAAATSTTTTTSFYTGYPKHGAKPNTLGVGNGVEKKNGSPGHAGKPGAQPPHPPVSPGNGNSNILGSTALQPHQYLDGTWSMSRANGVTLYPYQISQMISEGCREGLTEAALNRYNADRLPPYTFPAPQVPLVTTAPPSGTSAAASFFASPGCHPSSIVTPTDSTQQGHTEAESRNGS
ncbi:hypothetical protein AAFF_G00069610 [Aldrovandia affinis]|uniref:Kinesin-like protein KIF26A/B helical domain-containing protein n=1 Tax=Aldrovandia affinis TaxID=143900 RepID=A0AAD7WDI9_9TELE|nr:hypothetical protein AAFF_G00069610 [Aldrovandia affinis]